MFKACLSNPMALVLSLYDKQFLKNQNFRRTSSVKWGKKPSKWNGTYAASAPWVVKLTWYSTTLDPFYPSTMFQNPMSKPSCHKSRKTIITQKVLVTQSSNIMHCNWHTQKSISADFQAFLNTFSSFKLTFFYFFVRRSSTKSHKFHILLMILTGKITAGEIDLC